MVKLIWTDQSIDDLGDIANYIGESSEKYASLTVQKLYKKVDILKSYPKSGRMVAEKNEEQVRELIEGNYRIIYEIASDDLIYILTIYHSSRNLKL